MLLSTIFFVLVSIIVVGSLGLSAYLIFNSVKARYKYNNFSLPVEKNMIIGEDDKDDEIINPIEVTKFNISEKNDDGFISESRDAAKIFHEEKIKQKKKYEEEALKRAKRELSRKKTV